ncbi:MAG: SGNH/GDSL hydrolase family protein [Clostridia bacterium]|nr:SGNH/GDSL hydrolase family protein [Clostridia bacterium]
MNQIKKTFLTVLKKAPLLLFAVLFCLIYAGCRAAAPAKEESSSAPHSSAPSSSQVSEPSSSVPSEPSVSPSSESSVSSESDPESVYSDTEDSSSEAEPSEPEKLEFTKVDEDYFEDALFFGNSRTRLMGIYAPIGNAFFYGGDIASVYDALEMDMGVEGYSSIYDVLATHDFGKVYINFGINECGFDDESFMESYEEIIDVVRRYQPDALIFLVEIMYVSEEKCITSGVFEPYIIDNKNEHIKALADGKTIFYLPVNEIADDGRGYMKAELTGDGVHLTAATYHLLSDYIMEHGIVDRNHPAHPAKSSESQS